jgi:apolipoprotein D and lipocalin family protein
MQNNVSPVCDFELNSYLGWWYEIARLDRSFEQDFVKLTAEFVLRKKNIASVVNQEFLNRANKWNEANSKAYFVNSVGEGYLKVPFFGPFYGSYVIYELYKESYQYAFVSAPDSSNLWLLSRTKNVSDEILGCFIQQAKNLEFNTSDLIMINQNQNIKNGKAI